MPKPTVPQVLPVATAYYAIPGNGAGGCLHIVLDDQNVEDCWVDFCINYAVEHVDEEGFALATILRSMSKTQRLKLAYSIPYVENGSGSAKDFWTALESSGIDSAVVF